MTLTELSYYVRKTLPIAIIGFVFFIVLYFVARAYFGYLDSKRPKQLSIEPIFGAINRLVLTNTIAYPEHLPQFILDTIEGQPKTATQTAKVFFLPPKITRFGYLQKIYLMAKKFGFDTEVTKHKIENQEAVFTNSEKELRVSVADFNFSYDLQYQDNEELFQTIQLPELDRIKEKTKEFLHELGRYPEELAQGKENILFLKYDAQTKEFAPVARKDEANAFEIDFFRPDIEGISVVSPSYFTSQNFVVATFQNDIYIPLKARIHFFEKEDQKVGVYPLKTGDTAWEELKNKQGLIVSKGKNREQITIKKMMLAYVDPDVYQSYLQPVYVFLSGDGFVAYVSAIKQEYSAQ